MSRTFGRTPWSSSLDMSFAYLPKFGAYQSPRGVRFTAPCEF